MEILKGQTIVRDMIDDGGHGGITASTSFLSHPTNYLPKDHINSSFQQTSSRIIDEMGTLGDVNLVYSG